MSRGRVIHLCQCKGVISSAYLPVFSLIDSWVLQSLTFSIDSWYIFPHSWIEDSTVSFRNYGLIFTIDWMKAKTKIYLDFLDGLLIELLSGLTFLNWSKETTTWFLPPPALHTMIASSNTWTIRIISLTITAEAIKRNRNKNKPEKPNGSIKYLKTLITPVNTSV